MVNLLSFYFWSADFSSEIWISFPGLRVLDRLKPRPFLDLLLFSCLSSMVFLIIERSHPPVTLRWREFYSLNLVFDSLCWLIMSCFYSYYPRWKFLSNYQGFRIQYLKCNWILYLFETVISQLSFLQFLDIPGSLWLILRDYALNSKFFQKEQVSLTLLISKFHIDVSQLCLKTLTFKGCFKLS